MTIETLFKRELNTESINAINLKMAFALWKLLQFEVENRNNISKIQEY